MGACGLRKSSFSGLLSLLLAFTGVLPSPADEPLQGRVEDTQPMQGSTGSTNLQDDLQAKLDQIDFKDGGNAKALKGSVKKDDKGKGKKQELQGGVDDAPTLINLGAAQNDPDSAEPGLEILWDRWRNTLTQTIQAGTINLINIHNDVNFVFDPARQMMVSRYPVGIAAMYSCDVLPDRRIVNIHLIRSSGNQYYDQAVLQAINQLQGKALLQYPKGSKRQSVNQQASISTSLQSNFQNFQFGDVERR